MQREKKYFIRRVVYSPDGATVVIAFVTNKIDVWSTKDWHLIKTFKAHKNWISLAVSSDGNGWLPETFQVAQEDITTRLLE